MRMLCIVVAFLLLPVMDVAWACSDGKRPSVEEQYAGAAIVFLGHLVRVEENESPTSAESASSDPTLVATFRIVEVFKGNPPAGGRIQLPAAGSCDSPVLLVALDHVLFLDDPTTIRSRDEAMFVYDQPNNDITGERKHLLDELRSLSAKAPK